MSAPGQEPIPPEYTPEAVSQAQLTAAYLLARKAGTATSAAEAKDFAQAALLLAQGLIVMDPSLSQGGTPIEHDIALETVRQQGAVAVEKVRGDNALRQAKETAAAPTPAKRKTVSVRRDGHGRASEYSVEG